MYFGGLPVAALFATQRAAPVIDLNFISDPVSALSRLTVARASGGTYFDPTNTMQTAASNVARIDYGPAPLVTNGVRNSVLAGAASGTPGTLPTNFSVNAIGLSQTITVGANYIDLRLFGTTTGQYGSISFETATAIASVTGQVWINSCAIALVSGTTANIAAVGLAAYSGNSSGAYLSAPGGSQTLALTSVLLTYSNTITITDSANAFIKPILFFNASAASGQAVDFTLRISQPQFYQPSAFIAAPFYVPTSGAIATNGGTTNLIRNSTAQGGGAAAIPNFWSVSGNPVTINGMTFSIVGTVAYPNGMTALRCSISGTASANGVMNITFDGSIAVAGGMTYIRSLYYAVISGSYSGNIQFWGPETNAAGGTVADNQLALSPTTTLTRYVDPRTLGAATVTYKHGLLHYFNSGQTANYVFDVAAPQLEPANGSMLPGPWVPTSGTIANVGAVPRGLLVEEQRTNSIRNPRCEGAVAGSPGTAPTYWQAFAASSGLTPSLALSSEAGIPCIDFTVSGTTTAAITQSTLMLFDIATAIAAASGQTWTGSVFTRLVAGSLSNVSLLLSLDERNSTGSLVSAHTQTVFPTSSALATQRQSYTFAYNGGATVATTAMQLRFSCASGVAVNFTLRIGLPQLELGAFATSPMMPPAGSPAASTRAGDGASYPFAGGLQYALAIEASTGNNAQSGTQGVLALFTSADNNSTNDARLFVDTSGNVFAFTRAAGSIQINQGIGTRGAVPFRAALSVGPATLAAFGGATFGPYGTGAPASNGLMLGNVTGTGVWSLNGYIRRARLWNRALSATELQMATS